MRALLVAVLIACEAPVAPLEPEIEKSETTRELWTEIIDGDGNDWPAGVAVLPSDVVVLGWSASTLLVKSRTWEDRRSHSASGSKLEIPRDIAAHPDGGVVVLASTESGAWILRYDANGALSWETEVPDARAYSLAIDRSGTAYIAGEREGHALIVRIDRAPEVLIEEPPTEGARATFDEIAIDGDRLIASRWESDRTQTKAERADLRRYRIDGTPELSTALDCGGLLAVAPDGVIYTARGGELADQPIILCRYDAEGRLTA